MMYFQGFLETFLHNCRVCYGCVLIAQSHLELATDTKPLTATCSLYQLHLKLIACAFGTTDFACRAISTNKLLACLPELDRIQVLSGSYITCICDVHVAMYGKYHALGWSQWRQIYILHVLKLHRNCTQLLHIWIAVNKLTWRNGLEMSSPASKMVSLLSPSSTKGKRSTLS